MAVSVNFGCPYNKSPTSLGFILGPPDFWKLPNKALKVADCLCILQWWSAQCAGSLMDELLDQGATEGPRNS